MYKESSKRRARSAESPHERILGVFGLPPLKDIERYQYRMPDPLVSLSRIGCGLKEAVILTPWNSEEAWYRSSYRTAHQVDSQFYSLDKFSELLGESLLES